jgi:hypothetical protein
MTRQDRPQRWLKTEAKRLMCAVQDAGLSVACVEIDHAGKVRVIPGKPETSTKSENPWDAVLTHEKRTA